MDKSLILNEIKQYLNLKSDKDFADFLDIKQNTLSSWRSRNTMDYERLISKCDFIDANWLFTHKGSMLKENINDNGTQVYKLRTDKIEENQEVPLYELEATAGLSSLFETGKAARVLDSIKIPNLPKCDGAISVTGDSMYPLLKSGDIVLFRQAAIDDIFFGEMYIVSVKNEWEEYLTIKYVQRSEKGDEWIKLVSQNQHHQSRDIHLSKVTALALVKASIRINTMM